MLITRLCLPSWCSMRLFLVLSISNFELINLKYPHIIDPRLKALAADLYALTRYVGAKDRTNGTNDEGSDAFPTENLPTDLRRAITDRIMTRVICRCFRQSSN
ncbi:hypothetical protein Tco_1033878 [Tanacetum coccineum]